MKLLPDPERLRRSAQPGGVDGIGQGTEIAVGILVFFGIGFVVDRVAGTTPIFMIVFTVFCAVGQFVRMWFGYDARMRSLEADRTRHALAHQDAHKDLGGGR
jgi:F0F1-type ATP synthase assembly protein I